MLGERINTIFREQGITVVSILTAISLAISTIVASIVASCERNTHTSNASTTHAGQRRWIQKTLKIYIKLAKETWIKSIKRITGYHRWSIELVIVDPF